MVLHWNIIKGLILGFIVCCLIGSSQSLPLPACSYEDEITFYTSLEQWQRSLLDTIYKLPADYIPTDLVFTAEAGLYPNYKVRRFVLIDLKLLMSDAAKLGHPIAIQSAYRSYAYQEKVFNYWVERQGLDAAKKSSARPGHSEHQLGTTLDFRSADGPPAWELADWAKTEAGAWMMENAWRYGFVLSYPKNKEDITCYVYEPWHYRYMGRELARKIHESGLTLREWLWLSQ